MADNVDSRAERMSRRVTALVREGHLGETLAAAQELCDFLRRTLGDYHPTLADALPMTRRRQR